MNRTPATIYQYYGTEADARDGTMGLIKMYGGGIDTTGWPGPLP